MGADWAFHGTFRNQLLDYRRAPSEGDEAECPFQDRRAGHFSKREYMMGDHQPKVIQELLIDLQPNES